MRRFSKIALNSVLTFIGKFTANLFGPAIHHSFNSQTGKSRNLAGFNVGLIKLVALIYLSLGASIGFAQADVNAISSTAYVYGANHHTKAQIAKKSFTVVKSKNGDSKAHLVFY
jgi:hypothetical protein